MVTLLLCLHLPISSAESTHWVGLWKKQHRALLLLNRFQLPTRRMP